MQCYVTLCDGMWKEARAATLKPTPLTLLRVRGGGEAGRTTLWIIHDIHVLWLKRGPSVPVSSVFRSLQMAVGVSQLFILQTQKSFICLVHRYKPCTQGTRSAAYSSADGRASCSIGNTMLSCSIGNTMSVSLPWKSCLKSLFMHVKMNLPLRVNGTYKITYLCWCGSINCSGRINPLGRNHVWWHGWWLGKDHRGSLCQALVPQR